MLSVFALNLEINFDWWVGSTLSMDWVWWKVFSVWKGITLAELSLKVACFLGGFIFSSNSFIYWMKGFYCLIVCCSRVFLCMLLCGLKGFYCLTCLCWWWFVWSASLVLSRSSIHFKPSLWIVLSPLSSWSGIFSIAWEVACFTVSCYLFKMRKMKLYLY